VLTFSLVGLKPSPPRAHMPGYVPDYADYTRVDKTILTQFQLDPTSYTQISPQISTPCAYRVDTPLIL